MSDSEKLDSPMSKPVAIPFGTTTKHTAAYNTGRHPQDSLFHSQAMSSALKASSC